MNGTVGTYTSQEAIKHCFKCWRPSGAYPVGVRGKGIYYGEGLLFFSTSIQVGLPQIVKIVQYKSKKKEINHILISPSQQTSVPRQFSGKHVQKHTSLPSSTCVSKKPHTHAGSSSPCPAYQTAVEVADAGFMAEGA